MKAGFVILFIMIQVSSCGYYQNDEVSFWVWRSDDLSYVKSNSSLIIYQGDYLLPGTNQSFIKRGLSPTKDLLNKDISLLVRVYSLSNATELSYQISYLIEQWRDIGVYVKEVQIDHDSPSGNLLNYSDYLRQLSLMLAMDYDDIGLSVTGLVTWLHDNPDGVKSLSKVVKYINYQLYNSYHPIQNIESYYRSINAIRYPYKIGITTSPLFKKTEYPKNEFYKGTSIFLNKPTN